MMSSRGFTRKSACKGGGSHHTAVGCGRVFRVDCLGDRQAGELHELVDAEAQRPHKVLINGYGLLLGPG